MRIGILCAIPKEIHFFDLLPDSAQLVGGRTFFKSKHSSHDLVVVECGIGKVNAAMVSTLLVKVFDCEMLIFSGVAGGIDPEMEIGEVIVGKSLIQYDYGALKEGKLQVFRAGNIPMGQQTNELEFVIDPKLKKKINAVLPDVKMGTILTGDVFLQCGETRKALFERFGAQAIEMEGGAVAQVAEQFEIPALVVRCLSDLAGANGQKLHSAFLKKAAESSFQIVQTILKVLF
jgi:adenosylhomocysteine nucleosidase